MFVSRIKKKETQHRCSLTFKPNRIRFLPSLLQSLMDVIASVKSLFEVRIIDVAILCENAHLKYFVFGDTTGPAKFTRLIWPRRFIHAETVVIVCSLYVKLESNIIPRSLTTLTGTSSFPNKLRRKVFDFSGHLATTEYYKLCNIIHLLVFVGDIFFLVAAFRGCFNRCSTVRVRGRHI